MVSMLVLCQWTLSQVLTAFKGRPEGMGYIKRSRGSSTDLANTSSEQQKTLVILYYSLCFCSVRLAQPLSFMRLGAIFRRW